MAKKPNPNSPANAEQCEAAHKAGVTEGNGEGLAIYLTVMRDKFGKGSRLRPARKRKSGIYKYRRFGAGIAR